MITFSKKLMSAALASSWAFIVLPILSAVFSSQTKFSIDIFAISPLILLTAIPVTFTYGIFTSWVIDIITNKWANHILCRFVGYLFFGSLLGVISPSDKSFLYTSGITISILFFIFDELLKKKDSWSWLRSPLIWTLLLLPYLFLFTPFILSQLGFIKL